MLSICIYLFGFWPAPTQRDNMLITVPDHLQFGKVVHHVGVCFCVSPGEICVILAKPYKI